MSKHGTTLLLGTVAALALVAAIFAYNHNRQREATREFPGLQPVLDQFAAPGTPASDPAQCLECHREAMEKWRQSDHFMANAPLKPVDRERLLDKRTELLDIRNIRWFRKGDTIVLKEPGIPEMPVVGTIGVRPLIQYLLLAPDGRIQTQDVSWDVEEKEWFSVFESFHEETPRMPGEWGHWTGQGMNWDANCAYCHMTAYHKNYDPLTDSYDRTWDRMTVTCNQCHPQMDAHMSQVRNGNNDFDETLSPQQVMETCAICHSRRDQLTADRFVAGDAYEDHFHLTTMETRDLYHPDGQVIGENYVYGSLMMSKMGHAGVTCMDCHDPHSGGFILPVENNALCMRCHGSGLKDAPKIDPVAHSHHPAESTGNLCIECHMPITRFMGRDPRRDHSFSIPDPRLTIEMGIPNVCSKCHDTQSDKWNMDYAEQWYGPDMNADRRKKARLMRDLFDFKPGAGERLKEAVRTEPNRFWKATYVAMFRYIEFDREAFDLLLSMVGDPDPMVRSAAIRLVGMENVFPEQRQALYTDPLRSVRISAALSTPEMKGLPEPLDEELREYLSHTADSPMGALRLSSYWQSHGDRKLSLLLARRAPEFDQYNTDAYRLAAIQLNSLGENEAALEMFGRALKLEPENAILYFNLGLLQAEMQRSQEALSSLQKAVQYDPRMENAWYNLVVFYWQTGDMEMAREELTRALVAIPDSQRLKQLARQMPPPAN